MDCFVRTVTFNNQPWFCRLRKITEFRTNLRNASHQYFKLEIEPAAEKSSAYAAILASGFVFVLVISNTISMSGITDKASIVIATGSPWGVPLENFISAPPVINKREGNV